MLKKLQLSKLEQVEIIKYCQKKKIKFLSSAFDRENLKFLLKNKIDFIKIPSGEITNLPLLKFIRSKKKKILLSTGASTLKEIKDALKILASKKKGNITILHCNSAYPTPLSDINLNVLNVFKKIFNYNFGISDHSLSINVPVGAAALGASVIEKHFTLSRKMKGPDHNSSLEPKELKKMVQNIREIEQAMGKSKKFVTRSEKQNRKIIRKSLVANSNIKKGEKFSRKNITEKRPAGGISPMDINKVLGKKATRNFKVDEKIKL